MDDAFIQWETFWLRIYMNRYALINESRETQERLTATAAGVASQKAIDIGPPRERLRSIAMSLSVCPRG